MALARVLWAGIEPSPGTGRVRASVIPVRRDAPLSGCRKALLIAECRQALPKMHICGLFNFSSACGRTRVS